jgi:hypothetical protein
MNEQEMTDAGYENLGFSNGWNDEFHAQVMALWFKHGGRPVARYKGARQDVFAVDGAKIFWTTSL